MFGNYVYEKSSAQYNDRIIIIDNDNLEEITNYSASFKEHDFKVIKYKDDLNFRLEYEKKFKSTVNKLVVIADSHCYIPYDIWCNFHSYVLSLSGLFPKLNSVQLKGKSKVDLDLICIAYRDVFDNLQKKQQTDTFFRMKVYSKENILIYLKYRIKSIQKNVTDAITYKDWFVIAQEKAIIDVLAARYNIYVDTADINEKFCDYVLNNFGKISQSLDKDSPVLVSKVMDYINDSSNKFVLIVMDGMSEFDWNIISRSFEGIRYNKTSVMAMIPTTTSISRQCLLSNKYPSQLINPWRQNKEKQEFINCAKKLGFKEKQINYERGYETTFSSLVRCATVIINDVDDLVHAQHQGRIGMYNDITVLANQRKLVQLTKKMLASRYDVYITADHGNTPCIGLGKFMGAGVEVETKSRRMLVLKDFADKSSIISKYGMIDYPKYYLTKDLNYLVCDVGTSLDTKGKKVMSHGGITLDEVVVPFIKIKAEDYNG